MKLKSLLIAALVATSTAAFAAETAPLTFNGVLTMSDAQQFGLTTADASKSGWVKLGGVFDGYVLKSYDAPTETLTLERAGKTYTVSLSDGKFSGTAGGAGTKATLAEAQAVVDQMHFDKLIERSLDGQRKAMSKMAEQMAAQSGGKVSAEDLAAHQKRVMDTMLEAMNPEQMKKEMAQIYSEMFTKEQLASVAAFNATPAGKAMIEKQPDVQQRLQELMMPRLMSAMPKIQQMGKEFGQQQKAKAQAKAEAAKASETPASAPAAASPSETKP
jgi:uncharacterized protein